MAKKFGKILLLTAAIGTAAAAAYYYMQKKDADLSVSNDSDDDYDDFSEDLDEDVDASRNYVSLNRDTTDAASAQEESSSQTNDADKADGFTPLAEQLAQKAEEKVEEVVEEFFDEDDSTDAEPPIQDN